MKFSASGLYAIVGDSGAGKSTLIKLLSALAKQSSVYIFDEPTAALDILNEKKIKEIIEVLAKEKIVLIITHNLGLLSVADYIYVMKQWKVIECGKY